MNEKKDIAGILASISWNSNKWAKEPTETDMKKSKYGYVIKNKEAYEHLNFGHLIYPPENDNFYIGYTPMFQKNFPKEKDIKIIFLFSSDYHDNNKKIVGFYGFPSIGNNLRKVKHELYKKYKSGNIKSHKEDIFYFDTPIIINKDVNSDFFLPEGKQLSKQKFNYLNLDNVCDLLNKGYELNSGDLKLGEFIKKFPLQIELKNQQNFIKTIDNIEPNSLRNIHKLEQKAQNESPEAKQRISKYIERGSIANRIKKLTNYECLICKALDENSHSFKKRNGEYYIEAHHIEPVSTLKKGVLSSANIITVCANHHRQLHYGKVIVHDTGERFDLEIDEKEITINKIIIESS